VAAEGISTETRKFEVAYIFREHGEAYRDCSASDGIGIFLNLNKL